jgi:hypothetical protein
LREVCRKERDWEMWDQMGKSLKMRQWAEDGGDSKNE